MILREAIERIKQDYINTVYFKSIKAYEYHAYVEFEISEELFFFNYWYSTEQFQVGRVERTTLMTQDFEKLIAWQKECNHFIKYAKGYMRSQNELEEN